MPCQQQDRLLNLRLLDEIDESTFAAKSMELRDRIARLSLDVEADVAAKRQLLEIVCLNFRLAGANLVSSIRKPFDVLAEGLLVSYSRGDWTPLEHFLAGVRVGKPAFGGR